MRKIGFLILIVLLITILAFGIAYALPPNQLPTNPGTEIAQEKSGAINDGGITAPPPFVQDLPESQLNKIVFIRYAPAKACGNLICEPGENWKKCPSDCPPPEPTPSPAPTPTLTPTATPASTPSTSSCYGFLSATKPKWNWVENFAYTAELGTISSWATQQWDGLTDATVFGSGVLGAYPWGVYDGKNAISFGQYNEGNVLAVTAIWYQGKNIYEYDIMFDIDYFPNGAEGAFDLDTVALHEFGHAAGLADLYETTCSDQVMYGYVSPGEIRTTFGSGDTTGIQILYGP